MPSIDLAKTPSFRLDGKRALVTGGGRGIGLAAASALAAAGAHVTLAARTKAEIEDAAAAIRARGEKADALVLDVTNIEAAIMPASEVIASYHDLWHVEQSFRMSKTDLRARPMFHHTRDAIEAHLTIVFAALAVARYLQNETGLSIKRIIRALRPLQHVTVTIAGHQHHARDPLTDTAQTILDSLSIQID